MKTEAHDDDSSIYLGMGLGLGAYATATTILIGFTCPVCVIAAPTLIATGIYKKVKSGERTASQQNGSETPGEHLL